MRTGVRGNASWIVWAGIGVAWLVLAASPAVAGPCSEREVEANLRAIVAALDERPRAVLPHVGGLGRRLLAARSYLRAGDSLPSRWSWTADQIAAYEQSQEYTALRAEIDKVTQRFEALNPGYTLYVNLTPRSVDLQLERWNTNDSVARAAEQILKAAVAERCRRGASSDPALLRRFLTDWTPPALATLAAPGLSRHGQLRAFDFQVKQGERIVAGPDASTIAAVWTAQGWTIRLREAVSSATTQLQGPLEHPDEPWHYVYQP